MSQLYSGDRGASVVGLSIAMIILTTLSIGFRFWSRTVMLLSQTSRTPRFWWDDWVALGSLPFALTQFALTLRWQAQGLGKHLVDVPKENATKGFLLFYILIYFYDFAITLPKFSVLLFYARVFNVNSYTLRISLWVTAGIIMAWLVGVAVPTNIAQCNPIRKAWQPEVPGHCLNTYQWLLSGASMSVILDAIILVLPLPTLWNLQLKPLRKVIVIGAFVCSYSVIAISIGRLVVTTQLDYEWTIDLTYNVVPLILWSTAEPAFLIFCICLPSMFALIKQLNQHGFMSLVGYPDQSGKARILGDFWDSTTKPHSTDGEELTTNAFRTPEGSSEQFRHDLERPAYVAMAFGPQTPISSAQTTQPTGSSNRTVSVRRDVNIRVSNKV